MSFSYDAGTSTPNLAGLVEIGSIRINDGTFHLISAGGLLLGTPATRDAVTDLPSDHGGFLGAPFYAPRDLLLEGQIRVPTVPDLWAAKDLLDGVFDLDTGLQIMTVNTTGWAAARQLGVIVTGKVEIIPPSDFDAHHVGIREFTVGLLAPDPRLYSVTEHSQVIGTATAVVNAGNKGCPIKVRFNGPQTNPKIDLAGTSGSCRIRYAGTIPSGTGKYVEVAAFASSEDGVYALDDAGINAMGTDSSYGGPVTAFSARSVPKGSSSWTATKDSGAGTTVLYWRDAW